MRNDELKKLANPILLLYAITFALNFEIEDATQTASSFYLFIYYNFLMVLNFFPYFK